MFNDLIKIIPRELKKYVVYGTALLCLTFALFVSPSVFAADFGNGDYGSCPFESDCASTVVTLPPSLQVNINLSNGQVISRNGYTILVTPLNGQSSSFSNVDFYIDGALIHTQAPDEEGTVSWFWNVQENPGTTIKIVVNGQNNQTVSQTFQVKLTALATNTKPTSAASIINQFVAAPKKVEQSISHIVAKLPPQIKYGLPYFLFLLLGCDTFLLFYRTRHEIAESRRLKALLMRERQYSELKHTFTQLVSHYLRTPVTVINGSLDLLTTEKDEVTQPALSVAHDTMQHLGVAISNLISQLSNNSPSSIVKNVTMQPNTKTLWRQASFYIPIGLIGLVAFCFDFLARHSKGFSIGQTNVIIQIVAYGSLSVLIYQIIRQQQLRQREKNETTHVLEAETAFNNDRDLAIVYCSSQLNKYVEEVVSQVTQLQPSKAKMMAESGAKQLQNITTKLLIASRLRGSHSSGSYTTVQLKESVNEALVSLEEKLAEKVIHVNILHNITFQVQSQDLFTIVLWTILDNALVFSEKGGSIEVDAKLTDLDVIISVTDHGAGIPTDKKFSLFQAFSKTEGAETFNHEGMGFSLYLDKLIMDYLLGDIQIESEPHEGTRVLLTLPQPIKS